MKSHVVALKHPLHPMLVPIPIATFTLALAGDISYVKTRQDFWYRFSSVNMGIGLAGALAAAVPGLIDYGTVVPGKAKHHATKHALLNVGIIGLFGANLALRALTDARHGRALRASVGLTTLGAALLGYSGWIGADLVYEHRIGVTEPDEEAPPAFYISLASEDTPAEAPATRAEQ